MEPIAFKFTGIDVSIYYNDYNPIHIHAYYGEFESIYEIHIDNGKLVDVVVRNKTNALPPKQDKKVKKFIRKNYKLIVERWTEVVILKKQIKVKRISGI
jgi:Zn/Cd-binding protein ZinT